MAKAVNRTPLTTEVQVRARVSPCRICGRQSGTGTGFSTSSSVFLVNVILPWISIPRIIWGMKNTPAGGRSSET
jgi:hypothetical protein